MNASSSESEPSFEFLALAATAYGSGDLRGLGNFRPVAVDAYDTVDHPVKLQYAFLKRLPSTHEHSSG